MKTILEQLDALAPLAAAATKGPWLLVTVNANPRGLRSYKQVVRATETGMLGGLPVPKTTMQLQFEAYGKMECQSDGTPDGYWPTDETKANAAFIAAARNFLTPETIAALRAAPAAPIAESREGAVVLTPQELRNAVVEAAKKAHWCFNEEHWLDTDNDGTMEAECLQIAYDLGRQSAAAASVVESRPGQIDFLLPIELLRNSAEAMHNQGKPLSAYAYQSAADHLALAAAPVATEGAGQSDGRVPQMEMVTEFSQIQKDDTLLVLAEFPEAPKYVIYQHVEKKDTPHDGQEVILDLARNSFFNFGMYAAGRSWVKRCYRLALPAAPLTPKANSRHAG